MMVSYQQQKPACYRAEFLWCSGHIFTYTLDFMTPEALYEFFKGSMGSLILCCLKTKSQKKKNHTLLLSFPFPTAAEMGCGLNKLEKRDDKRPGNIYSTLKRPQVETKIDVAYEYRFLEFTTLSTGEYRQPGVLTSGELRPILAPQPYPGHRL